MIAMITISNFVQDVIDATSLGSLYALVARDRAHLRSDRTHQLRARRADHAGGVPSPSSSRTKDGLY